MGWCHVNQSECVKRHLVQFCTGCRAPGAPVDMGSYGCSHSTNDFIGLDVHRVVHIIIILCVHCTGWHQVLTITMGYCYRDLKVDLDRISFQNSICPISVRIFHFIIQLLRLFRNWIYWFNISLYALNIKTIRPTLQQIKYLTLKNQGQGHGQDQNWWPHLRPSV